MKKAKLIINGKEFEVQLTEEQAQELTAQKKVTGFERAKANAYYYSANSLGRKDHFEEYNMNYDDDRYANANYYTDESLAEWCIRNDTLNRKMRRWAAEYNSKPIDWQDAEQDKWYVGYNTVANKLDINNTYKYCSVGVVYFDSYGIAVDACNEFGNEIKWLAENRPKWF